MFLDVISKIVTIICSIGTFVLAILSLRKKPEASSSQQKSISAEYGMVNTGIVNGNMQYQDNSVTQVQKTTVNNTSYNSASSTADSSTATWLAIFGTIVGGCLAQRYYSQVTPYIPLSLAVLSIMVQIICTVAILKKVEDFSKHLLIPAGLLVINLSMTFLFPYQLDANTDNLINFQPLMVLIGLAAVVAINLLYIYSTIRKVRGRIVDPEHPYRPELICLLLALLGLCLSAFLFRLVPGI